MSLPPENVALGDAALAAHRFWCASLGARECLDRGQTALAAFHVRVLGEEFAAWPEALRRRALARMATLIPALETLDSPEARP